MRRSAVSPLRALAGQMRTIRALILREMITKYGRDNIGFGWVVLEPMLLTLGVMMVWSLTIGHSRGGLRLVEFVFTGYMPLTLWRHITNSSVGVFRQSAQLLYHRKVTLFDIVWARTTLEFLAASAALFVIWGTLYCVGVMQGIANLNLFLVGWIMMGSLAAAVGFISAALTEHFEVSEKFILPMQYLILPISGFATLVDWLPYWAQKAMLLNPMVHAFEVFRAGFFGQAIVTHYSFGYFFIIVAFMLFCGLSSIRWTRSRVRMN